MGVLALAPARGGAGGDDDGIQQRGGLNQSPGRTKVTAGLRPYRLVPCGCPDWGIHTEAVEINHEKQYAVFRALVYNEAGKLMATATKKEDVKGFGDWLEKAETGAIGRALGMCGFGTDNDPDFDDGKGGDPAHIVDSPQGQRPAQTFGGGYGSQGTGYRR